MERIETVIVGGGQAGLATSYCLTQLRREHVVLEQAEHPANVWRNERWDSFTLVTPNWTIKMPGAEYDGVECGSNVETDRWVRCDTALIGLPPLENPTSRPALAGRSRPIPHDLKKIPRGHTPSGA